MLRSFSDPSYIYNLAAQPGLVSVGRDEGAMIKLDSFLAPRGPCSRTHAQFQAFKGVYYLTDLNSLNGTFVTRLGIKNELGPMILYELANNDVIAFGSPARLLIDNRSTIDEIIKFQNPSIFIFNQVVVPTESNDLDMAEQASHYNDEETIGQMFTWSDN